MDETAMQTAGLSECRQKAIKQKCLATGSWKFDRYEDGKVLYAVYLADKFCDRDLDSAEISTSMAVSSEAAESIMSALQPAAGRGSQAPLEGNPAPEGNGPQLKPKPKPKPKQPKVKEASF